MEGNSCSHLHNKLYPEPPEPGPFLPFPLQCSEDDE